MNVLIVLEDEFVLSFDLMFVYGVHGNQNDKVSRSLLLLHKTLLWPVPIFCPLTL